MSLTVRVEYGEYFVTLAVPPDVARRALDRLLAGGWVDHDLTEDRTGGWVRDAHRAVNLYPSCSELCVYGACQPDGDDALDGTVEPTELSLTDRLTIASALRDLLGSQLTREG